MRTQQLTAYTGYRKNSKFQDRHPTKRAPDKWESARFRSIFLALSFSSSQAESTPAHLRVTQTVGTPRANQIKNIEGLRK